MKKLHQLKSIYKRSLQKQFLPKDYKEGTFIGRVQTKEGPSILALSKGEFFDITKDFPTVTHLIRNQDALQVLNNSLKDKTNVTSSFEHIFDNAAPKTTPYLLSPIAAGVTFATSLLERVIEEQAKGDPSKSEEIREFFSKEIGQHLSNVKPGSEAAKKLKESFLKKNLWSQYLEVGLMEDCEVFTKSQPLSSVGFGSKIGILKKSNWNNPEPEIVLVVNPYGKIIGATIGNDVNLRDIEGRSALLLGKAKDNNASCSIGPFIRLLDNSFTIDDVRNATVSLSITGKDGFELKSESSMKYISRDVYELVNQTMNENHQYPDGLVLFVGTMFSPKKDRDTPGLGFTHKVGDFVTISSDKIGTLFNEVDYCHNIQPWSFGILDFIENLRKRNLV